MQLILLVVAGLGPGAGSAGASPGQCLLNPRAASLSRLLPLAGLRGVMGFRHVLG